ncbi:hypothetical protein D8S78_03880 [Natrialba swarupiae]|nr:hypothetical protein [Natrialba swarupiae]
MGVSVGNSSKSVRTNSATVTPRVLEESTSGQPSSRRPTPANDGRRATGQGCVARRPGAEWVVVIGDVEVDREQR